MRKLLYLIAILSTCLPALAQQYQYVPLIDSPAMWQIIHFREHTDSARFIKKCTTINYQFRVTGIDTVVANKTWKKVQVRQVFRQQYLLPPSPCTFPDVTPTVATYEDSYELYREDNKVITKYNGPFTLYDFNKVLGENIAYTKTITGIDTILIGNTLRRRFFTQSPSFGADTIIEGIGSLKAGPEGHLFVLNSHVTCHEYDGTIIYQNPDHPCGAIFPKGTPTDVPQFQETPDVLVYPNPFTDHIRINNVPADALGQLYNTVGQLIATAHSDDAVIATSNLPVGMYFLILKNNDGEVIHSQKLMKQ